MGTRIRTWGWGHLTLLHTRVGDRDTDKDMGTRTQTQGHLTLPWPRVGTGTWAGGHRNKDKDIGTRTPNAATDMCGDRDMDKDVGTGTWGHG